MKRETFEAAIEWLRNEAGPFAQQVAPLYKQLKWDWAKREDCNRDKGIPAASAIEAHLRIMIASLESLRKRGCWNRKLYTTSGGGLTIYIEEQNRDFPWDDVNVGIEFTYRKVCHGIESKKDVKDDVNHDC